MARPRNAAPEKKAVAEENAVPEKQTLDAPVRKSAKTASTNSAAPRRKGAKEAGAHRSESTVANIEFDPSQYRQEIAETAYYLWERRGGQGGTPEDDWREAEAMVRRKYSQPPQAVRAAGSGRG
jgi:hypothetical protein